MNKNISNGSECRVCLLPVGTNSMSLFDDYRESALFIYLNTLVNIEIRDGDGFPRNICKSCFLEFETAVNFKEKCHKSNEFLHSIPAHMFCYENDELIKNEVKDDDFEETLDEIEIDEKNYNNIPEKEVKVETKTKVKTEESCGTRTKHQKLICNDCGERFNTKYKLGVHWNKVHFPEALVFDGDDDAGDVNDDADDSNPHCNSMPTLKIENAYEILTENTEVVLQNELEIKTEPVVKKSRAIDLKLECHDCGNLFKSKCKLKVHWKRVHLPQALICSYCKRKFSSFISFNKHKNNPPKSCTGARSVRIEGEGKARIYHCKECNYKTKRFLGIMTHLVVHTGERKYQCDVCGAYYTQHCSLSDHKERAHGIIKVQVTCQYCGKLVTGRDKVYRHMRTHREERHTCPVCSKVIKGKRTLSQHMKRHNEVKTLMCHICGKGFLVLSDLLNHTKSHKTGTLYSCDLCKFKTYYKRTLKIHTDKHKDTTKVVCPICCHFFKDEEVLKKHHKNHFNHKYKCVYCEATFSCRKNHWRHVQIHKKKGKVATKYTLIKKECPEELEDV